MHGAGNDFIIINNISEKIPAEALGALAKELCTPHLSVGADGLMAVMPASCGGDYAMLFYNADGSLGEMCGNGARCIARYGYEHGLAGERQHIETTAGLVVGQRVTKERYRVRLNDPSVIDLHRRVEALGREFELCYLELGDPGLPHAVLLTPELEEIDRKTLFALGCELRYCPAFPKGANVTFVKPIGKDALKAVTFERGVEDFTLACGTGCGSTVAALSLLGLVSGKEVAVSMPGGELSVSVDISSGTAKDIYLIGPAVVVYEGEIKGK